MLAPFECLCGNFILPEPASYVFFYAIFNLRKLLYIIWECTGGSVLSGETSLQGAIREVKEELGILLTPGSEKLIYQSRRENVQDFYDVWLFHKDIKIEEMRLQETEVVDVQWVNPDKLFEMFRLKHLHPLITYVDQLIG